MAAKPCKRMDGLCNLTAAEKAERDARMYYWLNQRRIERVHQAAVRAEVAAMFVEAGWGQKIFDS